MKHSAAMMHARQDCSSRWLRFALTLCALFLLSLMVPRSTVVLADSALQTAGPRQNSTIVERASRQAQRRKEIQQRNIDNPEAEEGENVYRHSAMVHTLARVFGLSVETTSRIFEIFNFAIVWAVVGWFLGRMLPAMMRKRTERIQNQIQQARTATEDANRRMASVEERLSRLDTEIDAIRTQAHQEAREKEKQLLAALEQEKQSILHSSAQEIAAAGIKAQSQLKRLAAELAIERAKRNLTVGPEADRSLVESFLADLDRQRPSGGVN